MILDLTTNYDDLLEKSFGLRRIGRSNKDEVVQENRLEQILVHEDVCLRRRRSRIGA